MTWTVTFDQAFAQEAKVFARPVQIEIAAMIRLLQEFGPELKRPHCDTLEGSAYNNMKELRFTLPDGEWRIAFAFDPQRNAILLVGGSKSGISKRRFYKQLIRTADARFAAHLDQLRQEGRK